MYVSSPYISLDSSSDWQAEEWSRHWDIETFIKYLILGDLGTCSHGRARTRCTEKTQLCKYLYWPQSSVANITEHLLYYKKESVLTPKHKNIYETKRIFIQMGISLHDNLYSIVLKTNSVNVFSDSDYIINSLLTACVTQLLLFINSDGADGWYFALSLSHDIISLYRGVGCHLYLQGV